MGARTWEEGSLRTQPIPPPVGVGHPSSTAPQRLQVVSCKASRDSHAPPSTLSTPVGLCIAHPTAPLPSPAAPGLMGPAIPGLYNPPRPLGLLRVRVHSSACPPGL